MQLGIGQVFGGCPSPQLICHLRPVQMESSWYKSGIHHEAACGVSTVAGSTVALQRRLKANMHAVAYRIWTLSRKAQTLSAEESEIQVPDQSF